jgi:hypothetical protein
MVILLKYFVTGLNFIMPLLILHWLLTLYKIKITILEIKKIVLCVVISIPPFYALVGILLPSDVPLLLGLVSVCGVVDNNV